jgi:hypothetical protein
VRGGACLGRQTSSSTTRQYIIVTVVVTITEHDTSHTDATYPESVLCTRVYVNTPSFKGPPHLAAEYSGHRRETEGCLNYFHESPRLRSIWRILQLLGARLQVLGVILLLIAARRPILSP